ncbi:MAG: hypothetical protein JW883_12400 [Deltaproteobacteria bacterium]|nr:hypothetical protein [Deltaproteobacteria bacterium]
MEQYIIDAADRLRVPPIALATLTEEQIAILEGVLKEFKSSTPQHLPALRSMFLQGSNDSRASKEGDA